jgi:hypothetical protein
VLESRALRRIFGPKRGEETGRWREVCDEELRNLYSSLNIIRVIPSMKVDGRGMQHAWNDKWMQGFGRKT